MKILIAVPTYENITPDTFQSIYALDRAGHELAFQFVRGYDVATARNAIATQALDADFDYVLMIDNDVVVPPDALVNLLDDPQLVTLGYYAHRISDKACDGRLNVCKLVDKDSVPYHDYIVESQYTMPEIVELRDSGAYKVRIHGGGLGCALIKTDLLRWIDYPYFEWKNCVTRDRKMLSEDLFFCEQCRKAGIPVYTDTRVACGHLIRYIQWP